MFDAREGLIHDAPRAADPRLRAGSAYVGRVLACCVKTRACTRVSFLARTHRPHEQRTRLRAGGSRTSDECYALRHKRARALRVHALLLHAYAPSSRAAPARPGGLAAAYASTVAHYVAGYADHRSGPLRRSSMCNGSSRAVLGGPVPGSSYAPPHVLTEHIGMPHARVARV